MNYMNKFPNNLAGVASGLVLGAGLCLSAVGQNSSPQPSSDAQVQTGTTNATTQPNPNDSTTYATGKPLAPPSNEGFWGHLNPFARKKWVNRQVGPVKDRLNELDQLSAKNSSDIKDVDSRAQSGIHHAQDTADQATQQATAAGSAASQAQQTAQQASQRTDKLNSTVSNLDQYQQVSQTEIRFRSGQTSLNAKAKEALDQIASQLQGQKGYLVEVQAYSHARGQAGLQSSQHLADSVVRYLVEQHQVPVYRIHQLGMGNAQASSSNGAPTTGNVVQVTLVQNSLAALNSGSNGSSPIGATQQMSTQPSPQGAVSHGSAQQQP